jgi:hypothetical protein
MVAEAYILARAMLRLPTTLALVLTVAAPPPELGARPED